MNDAQKLWWEQAKSDHAVFVLLRRGGVRECHMLHYLQMAAEKISKAYLWRSGAAPPRSLVGLMPFLQALLSRGLGRKERRRIAGIFDYARPEDMAAWVKQVSPLAHDLQNLTPDLSNDGPNAEYPWPHDEPTHCPALHSFALWNRLRDSEPGRRLVKFLDKAIQRFEQYA
jgi:hypothetical protein